MLQGIKLATVAKLLGNKGRLRRAENLMNAWHEVSSQQNRNELQNKIGSLSSLDWNLKLPISLTI